MLLGQGRQPVFRNGIMLKEENFDSTITWSGKSIGQGRKHAQER
jgi:hypothetical protein